MMANLVLPKALIGVFDQRVCDIPSSACKPVPAADHIRNMGCGHFHRARATHATHTFIPAFL